MRSSLDAFSSLKFSKMPCGSSNGYDPTIRTGASCVDGRVELLENEILLRDQKVQALEGKLHSALTDRSRCEAELCSLKAYMNTLPTLQQVEKLKGRLRDYEEQHQQQAADLRGVKESNAELLNKISRLRQRVLDLNSSIENKAVEMEALQFTVQQWERRRVAAKEAGQVTVEDVVGEKIVLEDKFKEFFARTAKRERRFQAKIERLQAVVENQKRSIEEERKNASSHLESIAKMERVLEEKQAAHSDLCQENDGLKLKIGQLTLQLDEMKCRDAIRGKVDENVRICIDEIFQSHVAIGKLIKFIESAAQRQFLDPSLLFSCKEDFEDVQPDHSLDLKELAERRISQVLQLKKGLEKCQRTITDLYVANLSQSLSSQQCQVQ